MKGRPLSKEFQLRTLTARSSVLLLADDSAEVYARIVWTDLLFKRFENQRRQRKLYAVITYVHCTIVYINFDVKPVCWKKYDFLRPPTLPQIKSVPYRIVT
jgi:hypothetical protein